MKYKLPEVTLPTDSEMEVLAKDWWENLRPTTFLGWNKTMREHTFPYTIIPLSKEMMSRIMATYDGKKDDSLSDEIVAMLRTHGIYADEEIFVKLISRSPKDSVSTDDYGKPLPIKAHDILTAITGSMRCLEDLVLLLHLAESALVVRPYIEFEAWREWRVFVDEGKIVGISQYYYFDHFPELTEEVVKTHVEKIRKIVEEIAIPNMELPSFVTDVVVMDGWAMLLETNIFGLSDPCLFKNYDNFDGTTRVLEPVM